MQHIDRTKHDEIDTRQLTDFLSESNAIEGEDAPDPEQVGAAFSVLLNAEDVTEERVMRYLQAVSPGAELRDRFGMNVSVGAYDPPGGSPSVGEEYRALLEDVSNGEIHPFRFHLAFEQLHPFTDGNGRVGRLLWLLLMLREGDYVPAHGFLRGWYYQSLARVSWRGRVLEDDQSIPARF